MRERTLDFSVFCGAVTAAIKEYQTTVAPTVVTPLIGKWRAAALLRKVEEANTQQQTQQQEQEWLVYSVLAVILKWSDTRLATLLIDKIYEKISSKANNKLSAVAGHVKRFLPSNLDDRSVDNLTEFAAQCLLPPEWATVSIVDTIDRKCVRQDHISGTASSLLYSPEKHEKRITCLLKTVDQYITRQCYLRKTDQKEIACAENFKCIINAIVACKSTDTITIIFQNQTKREISSDNLALLEAIYLFLEHHTDSSDFKNDIIAALQIMPAIIKKVWQLVAHKRGIEDSLDKEKSTQLFASAAQLQYTDINTVQNDGTRVSIFANTSDNASAAVSTESATKQTLDINWHRFKSDLKVIATNYLNKAIQNRGTLRKVADFLFSDESQKGIRRAENLLIELEKIKPNDPIAISSIRQLVILASVIVDSSSKQLTQDIIYSSHSYQKETLGMLHICLGITHLEIKEKRQTLEEPEKSAKLNDPKLIENLKACALKAAHAYRNAGFGGPDGKRRAENFITRMEGAKNEETTALINAVLKSGSAIFKTALLHQMSNLTPSIDQHDAKLLYKKYRDVNTKQKPSLLWHFAKLQNTDLAQNLKRAAELCLKHRATDQSHARASQLLTTLSTQSQSGDLSLLNAEISNIFTTRGCEALQEEILVCMHVTEEMIRSTIVSGTAALTSTHSTAQAVQHQATQAQPQDRQSPSWTAQELQALKECVKKAIDRYLQHTKSKSGDKIYCRMLLVYHILTTWTETSLILDQQQQLLSLLHQMIRQSQYKSLQQLEPDDFLTHLLLEIPGDSTLSVAKLYALLINQPTQSVEMQAVVSPASTTEVLTFQPIIIPNADDPNYTTALAMIVNRIALALDAYQSNALGGWDGKWRAAKLRMKLVEFQQPNSSIDPCAIIQYVYTDVLNTESKILADMIYTATGLTKQTFEKFSQSQQPATPTTSATEASTTFFLDAATLQKMINLLITTTQRYDNRPPSRIDTRVKMRIDNFICALEGILSDCTAKKTSLSDSWRYLTEVMCAFIGHSETGIENDLRITLNVFFPPPLHAPANGYFFDEELPRSVSRHCGQVRYDFLHSGEQRALMKKLFDDLVPVLELSVSITWNQSLIQKMSDTVTDYLQHEGRDLGKIHANNLLGKLNALNELNASAQKEIITLVCAIVFQSTSTALCDRLLEAMGITAQQLRALQKEYHISNAETYYQLQPLEMKVHIEDWKALQETTLIAADAALHAGLVPDLNKRRFIAKFMDKVAQPIQWPISCQEQMILIEYIEFGKTEIPGLLSTLGYNEAQWKELVQSYRATDIGDIDIAIKIAHMFHNASKSHQLPINNETLIKFLLMAAEYCEQYGADSDKQFATQFKQVALEIQNIRTGRDLVGYSYKTYALLTLTLVVFHPNSSGYNKSLTEKIQSLIPYSWEDIANYRYKSSSERKLNNEQQVILENNIDQLITAQLTTTDERLLSTLINIHTFANTTLSVQSQTPSITQNPNTLFSATAIPAPQPPLATLAPDWAIIAKKEAMPVIDCYITENQPAATSSQPAPHVDAGLIRAQLLKKALTELTDDALKTEEGQKKLTQLLSAVILHKPTGIFQFASRDLREQLLLALAQNNGLSITHLQTLEEKFTIKALCAATADILLDEKELTRGEFFIANDIVNLKTALHTAAEKYLNKKYNQSSEKKLNAGIAHAVNILKALETPLIADREVALLICSVLKESSIADDMNSVVDKKKAQLELQRIYFISDNELKTKTKELRDGNKTAISNYLTSRYADVELSRLSR